MDLSVSTSALLALLSWLKRPWWWLFRPTIEFLSPVPGTYFSTNAPENESKWYVQIRIRPAALIRRVAGATVRILPFGQDNCPGISMRWFSRDSAKGNSKENLVPGKLYWIPFAVRNSNRPDGAALITNESWLKTKEEKWPVTAVSDWWVQIHAGPDTWKSERTYRLRVPSAGQHNGHFVLNVHYGNVY